MAACFFALYFVGSRCGLQSRIIYTLLCPCSSASSMTKYFTLKFLRSNLALNFILRLVFFRHTSLCFPCGRNCKQKAARSASVTDEQVCLLASFAAASSDVKILRLDFLRSNFKVKFVNFSSNFTRRNPRFENIKFSRYRVARLSDKIY